ncbi:MAG: response regulator transcription factor [Defluviitaleaceae bacterium]|nr:response regulator transcription factor [Defluviitaleaceae bacterium]
MKKIYIAEDEKHIRSLIKTFLTHFDYEVEAFENGDLLLDAFDKSPADMVILDVMMPGSCGFSICRKIRQGSDVPVIMLTARDSHEDYTEGLNAGTDDYLVKPFSPQTLIKRMDEIFTRRSFV